MKNRFRMHRTISALALPALALAVALLAPALAALAQSAPAAIPTDQRAYWRDQAAKLRTQVAAAALREQAATAAYSRMLTRRYPAGDAKLAIIEERDQATQAYADAITELRDFTERARAAGVPDKWIDPDGTPPAWWIDPASAIPPGE